MSSVPTPPPPQPPPETPNPNTTTTIRATATVVYPRIPPQNPIYHHPPITTTSNPNPNYPQLAPRPHDPTHLRYPGTSVYNRSFINRPRASSFSSSNNNYNSPRRPFAFSYPDPNPFIITPPQMRSSVMPPPKVGNDGNANGHKQQHQLRERSKDDVAVTVRDRKVRVNTNGSLYSLCRSWMRNGFPDEVQPHYPDTVKALPKPLPLAAKTANSADKKEGDKEGDEAEVSVEHLSARELLQRHVKRAKRIRSALREERHERITRYKTRLALLLPPIVDQSPLKNETN